MPPGSGRKTGLKRSASAREGPTEEPRRPLRKARLGRAKFDDVNIDDEDEEEEEEEEEKNADITTKGSQPITVAAPLVKDNPPIASSTPLQPEPKVGNMQSQSPRNPPGEPNPYGVFPAFPQPIPLPAPTPGGNAQSSGLPMIPPPDGPVPFPMGPPMCGPPIMMHPSPFGAPMPYFPSQMQPPIGVYPPIMGPQPGAGSPMGPVSNSPTAVQVPPFMGHPGAMYAPMPYMGPPNGMPIAPQFPNGQFAPPQGPSGGPAAPHNTSPDGHWQHVTNVNGTPSKIWVPQTTFSPGSEPSRHRYTPGGYPDLHLMRERALEEENKERIRLRDKFRNETLRRYMIGSGLTFDADSKANQGPTNTHDSQNDTGHVENEKPVPNGNLNANLSPVGTPVKPTATAATPDECNSPAGRFGSSQHHVVPTASPLDSPTLPSPGSQDIPVDNPLMRTTRDRVSRRSVLSSDAHEQPTGGDIDLIPKKVEHKRRITRNDSDRAAKILKGSYQKHLERHPPRTQTEIEAANKRVADAVRLLTQTGNTHDKAARARAISVIEQEHYTQRREFHSFLHSLEIPAIKNPVDLFVCPLCPYKIAEFQHYRQLIRHAATHLDLKLFKCPFCFKSFRRSDAARRHQVRCGQKMIVNYPRRKAGSAEKDVKKNTETLQVPEEEEKEEADDDDDDDDENRDELEDLDSAPVQFLNELEAVEDNVSLSAKQADTTADLEAHGNKRSKRLVRVSYKRRSEIDANVKGESTSYEAIDNEDTDDDADLRSNPIAANPSKVKSAKSAPSAPAPPIQSLPPVVMPIMK